MSDNARSRRPAVRGFKLGFFTQVPGRPGQAAGDLYRQLIDTIQAAEELGYEGVWVGQHHFGLGHGQVSSPLVTLAAAAARTTRIELGTAVICLPLEDPIRLAEDAATLDLLSNGRVNLGIGGGGGERVSFPAFGLTHEDRRTRYDSNIATLLSLLEQKEIVEGARLHPPAPGLRRRIWESAGTTDRARLAAVHGNGLLLGTFSDHPVLDQQAKALAYLNAWRDYGPPGTAPRIAAMRFVYWDDSRQAVARQVEPFLPGIFSNLRDNRPESDLPTLDTLAYLKRVTRSGSPDDVLVDLLEDPALLDYCQYFLPTVGLFPSAGLSTPGADLDIRRLEFFAREIAPQLGWQPPTET